LDLDEAFLGEAARLAESLRDRPELSHARWVASSVMHVTLRFLGDTDEALVPSLAQLVANLGDVEAVDVRATSLLAFPSERRAHVLGLRLEGDGALVRMAEEAERAVTALGFEPEQRAFRPHLTFARLRKPADLRRVIAEAPVAIAGRVTSIALYKSDLGPKGPTYTSQCRALLRVGTPS
jgi:2'-5' RNA ligase